MDGDVCLSISETKARYVIHPCIGGVNRGQSLTVSSQRAGFFFPMVLIITASHGEMIPQQRLNEYPQNKCPLAPQYFNKPLMSHDLLVLKSEMVNLETHRP